MPNAATIETIDNLNATTTGETFASFFAEDGVFTLQVMGASDVIKGRRDIARYMQGAINPGLERAGVVAQWGNWAAHAIRDPDGFAGMAIYEFSPTGKISHMWVYGDY